MKAGQVPRPRLGADRHPKLKSVWFTPSKPKLSDRAALAAIVGMELPTKQQLADEAWVRKNVKHLRKLMMRLNKLRGYVLDLSVPIASTIIRYDVK